MDMEEGVSAAITNTSAEKARGMKGGGGVACPGKANLQAIPSCRLWMLFHWSRLAVIPVGIVIRKVGPSEMRKSNAGDSVLCDQGFAGWDRLSVDS